MVLKRVLAICIAAACFALSVDCFAQRQTPGRPSINASAVFGKGFDGKMVGINGGIISWSNYQYRTHLTYSLEFNTHPFEIYSPAVFADLNGQEVLISPEVNDELRCFDLSAGGGYFLRLLGTRNRVFVISGGLSCFVGLRNCEALKEYEYEGKDGKYKNYPGNGLIIYFVPEIQMEVFPFRNVSIFASARPHLEVLSTIAKYPWFTFNWGVGLKFYL